MSDRTHMPKVDFNKDKVPEYIKDQIKLVEKDNLRRVLEFKKKIFNGRVAGFSLASVVLGIYGYTMYAVKSETFLDNFDYPEDED